MIKNLERIRPQAILDVVRSGVDMAKYVPGAAGESEAEAAVKDKKHACKSRSKKDGAKTSGEHHRRLE